MKQNIMKKWVKALRSGKFKQGTGTLKQYNRKGQVKYCCLGVLCELYNQDMKKKKKKTLPETIEDNKSCFTDWNKNTMFGNKSFDLPKEVMKWSGIETSDGQLWYVLGDLSSLSSLNDAGKKFKTIANIIEKNWENL